MNSCYAGIRKSQKSPCLFDTSRAAKWNKFDDWNHVWFYLENPDDFDCWRGIRKEWRCLEKLPPKKAKRDAMDLVHFLGPADRIRMDLVIAFVEC